MDWRRNFFDHRLRHDESENEKAMKKRHIFVKILCVLD